MHRLYKKTWNDRLTLSQELRYVLEAEPSEGAPAGAMRRVQLLIPPEPKIYMKIDGDPNAYGPNRTYKVPVVAPGAMVRFELTADQSIIMAADNGMADVSIIVEYIAPES